MSLASQNPPIEGNVNGEEKKVLRLLSYREYLKLSGTEKTRYLAVVSQELEDRQHKIREQMEQIRQGTIVQGLIESAPGWRS